MSILLTIVFVEFIIELIERGTSAQENKNRYTEYGLSGNHESVVIIKKLREVSREYRDLSSQPIH